MIWAVCAAKTLRISVNGTVHIGSKGRGQRKKPSLKYQVGRSRVGNEKDLGKPSRERTKLCLREQKLPREKYHMLQTVVGKGADLVITGFFLKSSCWPT